MALPPRSDSVLDPSGNRFRRLAVGRRAGLAVRVADQDTAEFDPG
jgi:hypothetical protein